ncbi:solute carrier family 35 member F6-like [Corticium candelabrum]|uniref:solute carrier family 35 member F6-like n=1 Tax=Corticium candelabrum TaxID=121492 RepID=UPI002E2552D9|nr:solute carrier family 35 member F6-like [Corticium candelabrum]
MDFISARGQHGVYDEHLCDSLFGNIPCPNKSYTNNKSYSHTFNHPFFQTLCMFLGEFSCFIVFKLYTKWSTIKHQSVKTARPFNPLIFLFAALCDMTSFSMMVVGLTMTYASSFQMLRGAVIVFTGLLSVAFLQNRLFLHHWIGMILVVAGLAVIGVGDALFSNETGVAGSLQVTGDLLIVTAQIIVAIQMTYEEKVIKKYEVPALQVVGWEGLWGFTVLGLLQIPFYFIPLSFSNLRPSRLENTVDAVIQIDHSWRLVIAVVGLLVSIAFFNFSGITVTKEMSATTRMVLDSVRTLFIWMFSLAIGWEKFQFLQPIGYVLLVCGTCVYYNLLFVPLWKKCTTTSIHQSEKSHLLLSTDKVN